MAQPRVAGRTPVACAACYQQKPREVHIDFASAIDGAQVDPANPRSPHVDWVVICEKCIRSAFELLPEQASDREKLQAEATELREKAASLGVYVRSLEAAIANRPAGELSNPDDVAAIDEWGHACTCGADEACGACPQPTAEAPELPAPAAPAERPAVKQAKPSSSQRRSRYQQKAA
jgi:hypothetical protein